MDINDPVEFCDNGVKDGNEEGVDCGGSCLDKCEDEEEGISDMELLMLIDRWVFGEIDIGDLEEAVSLWVYS